MGKNGGSAAASVRAILFNDIESIEQNIERVAPVCLAEQDH